MMIYQSSIKVVRTGRNHKPRT